MKLIFLFLSVCVSCFFNVSPILIVSADSGESNKIVNELNENVVNGLSNLDFGELDNYLNDVSNINFFNSDLTFFEVVKSVAVGDYFTNYSSISDFLFSFLFNEFKLMVPIIFMVIAIAILSSVLNLLKGNSSSGVSSLIHFVCFSIIVIIISNLITNVVSVTKGAIDNMTGQMSIIFPIMLTLLTAVGGVSSVSIYKPLVSTLAQGVSILFSKILFPIFIFSFVFTVVGNLSSSIKLDKFTDLFSSLFKWMIGITFTLFGTILTLQGISAGRFDSISIKATKFAVKSYIPLIGGYLSDGFDLILCSSIIIKNAVGIVGLFLMMLTILSPIIKILVVKFSMQIISAILQPIGENKISNFSAGCGKILVYPIVIMLGLAFMYLLSVGLIMITANVI